MNKSVSLALVLACSVSGLFGQVRGPAPRPAAVALKIVDPGPLGVATTTAVFSQFAIGGGFTTTFTLLNSGDSTVDGNLILTNPDGTPSTASLQSSDGGAASGSTIHIVIPQGGAAFVTAVTPNPADPVTKAGWARVESTGGALGGVSTFQLNVNGSLQTVAGVLASDPASSVTIPVDDDRDQSRFTGFAVANPSSQSITIRAVTVDTSGNVAATLNPITLPPGGQTATFLFQDPNASPKFRGSVVLIGQGGATFTAVALVQVQGATGPIFTAVPVVVGKAPNIN